jgi:hypothetical protein
MVHGSFRKEENKKMTPKKERFQVSKIGLAQTADQILDSIPH